MNLDNFKGKKVLVVGDAVLDKYVFGDVLRLSPEAPIPVLNHKKTSFTFGGGANAANNLASLQGDTYLAGIIGKDEEAEIFIKLMQKNNITDLTIKDQERPTIVKQRVMARYPGHPYQQVVRIDKEETKDIKGKGLWVRRGHHLVV